MVKTVQMIDYVLVDRRMLLVLLHLTRRRPARIDHHQVLRSGCRYLPARRLPLLLLLTHLRLTMRLLAHPSRLHLLLFHTHHIELPMELLNTYRRASTLLLQFSFLLHNLLQLLLLHL